ncbi:hypothetical protein [Sphingomonas limnosediminicola]|uniref:hypothetical protein n=1 Tax=Sphingomonas limnosediminicola TaxID=940133 RepID=UPI0031DD24C4
MAVALPAIAQQVVQQPVPAPVTAPTNNVASSPEPGAATEGGTSVVSPGDESAVEEISNLNLPPPPPPTEYPGWARRDPWVVGELNPAQRGLGDNPWGTSSGAFLSVLMRRMDVPLASRWAHIALRDALLAKARAPVEVNPVDWVAERSWLLLRMGEADAAKMLISAVDTDRFTPKMVQVAVQGALATADPPALCPLQDPIGKYDPMIRPLVQAMCSSLAGEPETASAQIDDARRRGRVGGIDLALAQKVVGAAGGGQAATIEWDPVDSLTSWRFGLATATGMAPPDRLMNAASPQLRAFQARAPLLTPQQRLDSAMVATGLGVFSSQSIMDLYSAIYDATDPGDLAGTDAWQLRQAFVGKDADARLAGIRKMLDASKNPLKKEALRAAVARAATMVQPDAKLAKDAPELISAMLAGGYDQAAARWASAAARMDDEASDRCWAMLALGAPNVTDVGTSRLNAFIKRDKSKDRVRSALLVAGLLGLGRITDDTANSLNRRYDLGLTHQTSWTRMMDGAAQRGQAGTVLVLTGTGFQTPSFMQLPGSHMFHAISSLKRTGQDFTARMIAAEALSRT